MAFLLSASTMRSKPTISVLNIPGIFFNVSNTPRHASIAKRLFLILSDDRVDVGKERQVKVQKTLTLLLGVSPEKVFFFLINIF